MKDKEKQKFEFRVVDKKTNKEANIGEIALKEDWAKGLMYCDMEGFAILEDGNLVLLDECGKWEYCPSERFEIIPEDSVVLSKEEYTKNLNTHYYMGQQETEVYYETIKIPQANKETAQKILNEIDCVPTNEVNELNHLRLLKMNIAKQFGVEIKE